MEIVNAQRSPGHCNGPFQSISHYPIILLSMSSLGPETIKTHNIAMYFLVISA